MLPTDGKKRVVIVSHPDFDKFGSNGIQEAKQFAEQLLSGQLQIIEMAEKSGEPAKNIEAVRQHVKAFQIVIRSIEKDII
jgi:hypothetical protein